MKVSPSQPFSRSIAALDAIKPKRQRCKNCPRFFTHTRRAGSPQLFCSDNCRKEFHRNGAAFGALREKLPGYIDKAVQKQLGRPTEEQYQGLLARIVAESGNVINLANVIVAIRRDLLEEIEKVGKLVAQLRVDFEAAKRGL